MAQIAGRLGRTGRIDNGGKSAAVARGRLKMNGRDVPLLHLRHAHQNASCACLLTIRKKRRVAEATRRVIPPPLLQTTTTLRPNAGPLPAPVPHPPHFAPTAAPL